MDQNTVHLINVFLGFGAIVMQVASLVVLVMLFLGPKENKILGFIHKHFILIGFLLSLGTTLASLFYSEVIKFPPCSLCWWARIFMYPLVILFGVALWLKDRKVWQYVLPMLGIGLIVSIYHNLGYYFGESSALPCDASGVSCYQHLVSEFGGYISIPMLSLTSVVSVLVVILVAYFYKKQG